MSGVFETRADRTAILYDRGVAQAAARGDGGELVFSFDADSNSYIVALDGDSFAFGPGEALVAGESFQFDRVDGDNIDSLRLGQSNYPLLEPAPAYVREALFLSRTYDAIDDTSSYDTASFVYGFASELAAVPVTGRAAHHIMLQGAHSGRGRAPYDTLTQLSGRGVTVVDFDTGTLTINAATQSINDQGQSFFLLTNGLLSGTASITAGENLFSGTFTAQHADETGPLSYTGEWSGQFFGPDADEIGGTLYGNDGDYFYSASFAGSEFDDLLASDTLAGLNGLTGLRSIRNGTQFFDAAPEQNVQILEQTLSYDADSQTYTVPSAIFQVSFAPANRTPASDSGDLLAYRATQGTVDGEAEHDILLFDGSSQGITLTYSSFASLRSERTNSQGAVIETGLDHISFGMVTPPDQLPQTGSASYAGLLSGTLRNGADITSTLTGESALAVDFLAGTLTASLAPEGVDTLGNAIAFSTYDFSGSIYPVANTIRAQLDGGQGALLGYFYGPAAEEFGATFTIEDAALGTLDGVAFGVRE